MVTLEELVIRAARVFTSYAPRILWAVLTLVVGLVLIKWIRKFVGFSLEKEKVDSSLRHFLESLVNISLKVFLFLGVISLLGVPATSFVAVLGAAGLAIGLALQGSLSNFAGGVLVLLLKPYQEGDFIEAQGFKGKVHTIEVFNTTLTTLDNKTVIIPNGALSNGTIVNYSKQKLRRVDLTFGVSYNTDIKKAKRVLLDVLKRHKKVLSEPAPFARVGELADSSVNFTVRAWVNTPDYWEVHFDLLETVKLRFDKEKISIPYPHMDVRLRKK